MVPLLFFCRPSLTFTIIFCRGSPDVSSFSAREERIPKKRENRVSTRATCIKREQVQYIYSRGKSKRTCSIFLYIKEREKGMGGGGERKGEKKIRRDVRAACLRVYKIPSECLAPNRDAYFLNGTSRGGDSF